MRRIAKGPEPRALTEYRKTAGANYDGYRDKAALRAQLVHEQRGLCCYCLARIRPSDAFAVPRMKIAHWHSQSLHRAEDLHYQNLLGACMGVTQRLQHCDTLQADRDIKFNPANPDHRIESRIRYLEDGSVVSDDEEFNEQLTLILGLNHTVFKQWRRNQLIDFQELLGEGTILREGWENELADWNGDSHTQDLEPYCQIVVDYIRKKLGR